MFLALYEAEIEAGYEVSPGDQLHLTEDEEEPFTEVTLLSYDGLSPRAQSILSEVLPSALDVRDEGYFVPFFNRASLINPGRHTLDLLPGVNRTLRNRILEKRVEVDGFESLDEIEQEVDGLYDVRSRLATAILMEIRGDVDNLFFLSEDS